MVDPVRNDIAHWQKITQSSTLISTWLEVMKTIVKKSEIGSLWETANLTTIMEDTTMTDGAPCQKEDLSDP